MQNELNGLMEKNVTCQETLEGELKVHMTFKDFGRFLDDSKTTLQDIAAYVLPPGALGDVQSRKATLRAMKRAYDEYERLLREAEAPAAVEAVLAESQRSWSQIASVLPLLKGT